MTFFYKDRYHHVKKRFFLLRHAEYVFVKALQSDTHTPHLGVSTLTHTSHREEATTTLLCASVKCSIFLQSAPAGPMAGCLDQWSSVSHNEINFISLFSPLPFPVLTPPSWYSPVRLHDSISEEGFHYLVFDL